MKGQHEKKWTCHYCAGPMRYNGLTFNGKLRYMCDKCQFELVGTPRTDLERLQAVVTNLEIAIGVSSSLSWSNGVKWAIKSVYEAFPDLKLEDEWLLKRPDAGE